MERLWRIPHRSLRRPHSEPWRVASLDVFVSLSVGDDLLHIRPPPNELRPMRIAFQGEAGAYSEAAALRLNASADVLACPAFDDVFAAVERQEATHGILPIENTIGGTIHRNYDLLLEHELTIVAEVKLAVVHHLIVTPGTRLDQIRRVYSHPQGLAQCEGFLRTLTDAEIVATYDTAGSAKMIKEKALADSAAIASEQAADNFGLEIIQSAIQDYADNRTRFLVVSKQGVSLGPPDKTTIVFTVPNEAGALFKALSVFSLRDIDLTKLESRPIPSRPFEYLFYADLIANREDLRCARALMHLAEFAPLLRTLGSYPAWREPDSSPSQQ
jgi:arogenate/prephenate dehydratase